jgi:hypothetical protein
VQLQKPCVIGSIPICSTQSHYYACLTKGIFIMQNMKETIAELEGLFADAKAKNEFEFILTLINYKSIGSPEATSNLYEWFEAIEFYKDLYFKLSGKQKTRIGCLLYSTFFENSDFYNILGSLCNIRMGYRGSSYLFWKTKKLERLLGTGEKIELISEKLTDCDRNKILAFLEDNHVQQIRNTFFHSAYSLIDDNYLLHDTDSINVAGVLQSSFEVTSFLFPKVENVICFFDCFKKSYIDSLASYKEEKVIKGFFPNLTDIYVHGSEKGLRGFTVKNTAQFYGQWVDSIIVYDEKHDMWFAKNVSMGRVDIESIEVDEQISRYEKKTSISKSDAEFFNMVDKIVQRNRAEEIPRVVSLLVKFGNYKYDEWKSEQNFFKKRSLPKRVLPFYEKAQRLGLYNNMREVNIRVAELREALEETVKK